MRIYSIFFSDYFRIISKILKIYSDLFQNLYNFQDLIFERILKKSKTKNKEVTYRNRFSQARAKNFQFSIYHLQICVNSPYPKISEYQLFVTLLVRKLNKYGILLHFLKPFPNLLDHPLIFLFFLFWGGAYFINVFLKTSW